MEGGWRNLWFDVDYYCGGGEGGGDEDDEIQRMKLPPITTKV